MRRVLPVVCSGLRARSHAGSVGLLLSAVVGALALCAGCGNPRAGDTLSFATGSANLGHLYVTDAYIPDPANPAEAAAYFAVRNTGSTDTLLSVSSNVSATVGLHETITQGSVGEMIGIPSLAVPSGATVRLSPGGYHVMIENPSTLSVGMQVVLTLRFAHAGALRVAVPVVPLSDTTDDGGMSGMHMN